MLGLLVLRFVLVGPTVRADEGTIKIGILHSLSGTMAISESVLKDTVLMLIADQNRKDGLLGRKLEPIVVDPASDWDAFAEKPKKPGNYSRRKRSRSCSAAGLPPPANPFCRSSSS